MRDGSASPLAITWKKSVFLYKKEKRVSRSKSMPPHWPATVRSTSSYLVSSSVDMTANRPNGGGGTAPRASRLPVRK
jgi:hypothetical protein